MNLTKQLHSGSVNTTSESTIDMSIHPQHQVQFTVPSWLTNALVPEAVCNGLRQHTAEFATGKLSILDCDIKRLRLRDGEKCWRGICLLTVTDADSAEPRTVSLFSSLIPIDQPEPETPTEIHPFGSEQWRCYLPELRLALSIQPQRSALAALSDLTDPEAARQLLEESIRHSDNHAYRNLRIESCQPQVMRYKPGSRCTILYQLEYPAALADQHDWPEVVVAKTHRGDKGRIAYEGMVALWQSPMRTSSTVAIAEPLAYIPDSHVLVQGPIREELTLKEMVRQTLKADGPDASDQMAELYAYIRKTAKGLAELHQSGAHCGEVVTWQDELAEIYESRDTLTAVLPQFTFFADDLLETLQQLEESHPADDLAPAHRSFRPAQVLLYQGDIGFIDFDGFCQAEPAMDVALFITTMKNMVRVKDKTSGPSTIQPNGKLVSDTQLKRLDQAEALCDAFLAEYEKHAPISRTRIALWEAVQLVSLLLGSWKKLKLDRLPYCQFMLRRHLERHDLLEHTI